MARTYFKTLSVNESVSAEYRLVVVVRKRSYSYAAERNRQYVPADMLSVGREC